MLSGHLGHHISPPVMSELVIIPYMLMPVRILLIRGHTPCPLSMHRGLSTMWVHMVLARGLSAHLGKPARACCEVTLIWKYSWPTRTSDKYSPPFCHLAKYLTQPLRRSGNPIHASVYGLYIHYKHTGTYGTKIPQIHLYIRMAQDEHQHTRWSCVNKYIHRYTIQTNIIYLTHMYIAHIYTSILDLSNTKTL